MQNVVVIHEKDHEDNDITIIGVASSSIEAERMIDEYYGGKFKVIAFRDVRDSNIEWQKTLAVDNHRGGTYYVTVWLEWFEIDVI